MAIFRRGSRFSNSRLGESRGETIIFPRFINYNSIESVGVIEIDSKNEFRKDLISLTAYGRDDLGWHIMAFNQLNHPRELIAGITLNIPRAEGII